MKLDVLNIQGEKTGRTVELPKELFGIDPNEHAVYLTVKQYLANQRQGTHKAKEKGEISGSTRKIKRQKGTGTARAGSIKSPVFRGGGRIFGPRPRNYGFQLNKKVKRLARKSALSAKAGAGQLLVVEDFSFEAPKTKAYLDILRKLGVDQQKSLLVTADFEREVVLSSRNLQESNVTRAQDLNTYDVLNAGTLILSEGSIEKLKGSFA
ncbi:MAG: 50S ribosomal protein L4 [Saprospiraceae bacterium]|nr:50S ribosomal protein L4 [Saprospiraceae bacterium]MCB0622891.1 50S ribosomal protein L4 [Saprospiraceae bacterium]MCB0677040.1 50S ribosomal protein L4 [Saprospiraceae bacterium]MCB0679773.1 50S ribosomal protein L4 [Saprospiraceae bacterium]